MRSWFLALLAAFAFASPGLAADRSADDWRALTLADVNAAYGLVAQNHPGAAPEMGDADFLKRLDASRALARERASRVVDFNGYAATLRGFASGLGDRHLGWKPAQYPGPIRYPGFWIDKKGADWVVIATDDPVAPPTGARLVACDGAAPEALAHQRLVGFRADPTVPAQMRRAARWLLIDDGNPFIPLPARCAFEIDGVVRDLQLAWRSIDIPRLNARATALYPGRSAGFGVRAFAGGGWISLEQLSGQGAAVVSEVRSRWSELATAPMLVIDLRGNGGGDSSIGDDLARQLFGSRALDRLRSSGARGCNRAVWRASEGNLRTLEAYQQRFANRGPEVVVVFKAEAEAVRAALAAGRALSGPVDGCLAGAAPTTSPASPPADAPYRGKVIVLTDGACFSSCLLMVNRFRGLGAIHAGQPTDAATWYMEVRDEPLPSGLGSFSVLGKVGLGATRKLGPFVPTTPFEGDMADTAALEVWVGATFAP